MSGTELKQILNAAGVNFTQVARMLGMSQQNFNKLFVAQDVKSGTVERISTAIGRDMSMFYPLPAQAATVTGDNSTAVAGNLTGLPEFCKRYGISTAPVSPLYTSTPIAARWMHSIAVCWTSFLPYNGISPFHLILLPHYRRKARRAKICTFCGE